MRALYVATLIYPLTVASALADNWSLVMEVKHGVDTRTIALSHFPELEKCLAEGPQAKELLLSQFSSSGFSPEISWECGLNCKKSDVKDDHLQCDRFVGDTR